jgi:superfamily II DNA or RNA helicase
MRLTPRPFQRQEEDLLLRGHRLLAWAPGVGKTLPLIRAGERTGMPQLWVTRADLREQAARVIAEQRLHPTRVQLVESSRAMIDPRADVVVVSYEMMRTPPIWKQLFHLAWGSIVFDEAHALKNSASTRTRAVYGAQQNSKGALFRSTGNVWLATGTPVLRDPMDLWPHVSRLWPHELPEPRTKDGWMNYHCVTRPGEYGPVVIAARRPDELRALVNRIGSVRDLELETRLDIDTLPISISPAEQADLRASVPPDQWELMEALFADIEGGEARQAMQDDARLLLLTTARRVLARVKARGVSEIARAELDGGTKQIIVWGHHVEALRAVVAHAKHPAGLLIGDTPASQRRDILASFMRGDLRLLAAGISVAGTGLDGLQCSQRAIFLEGDWLPGVNAQAIARQFRQGQQHPVHVSFTSVARSPDETVARVLARRARMITASVGVGT